MERISSLDGESSRIASLDGGSSKICDQHGAAILLGEKLGTGGEGSVFAVAAADLVAKLYHEPLADERHSKLLDMVSGCNDALRAIAAWPVSLLRDGEGGKVRGFLMPHLMGHDAVHNMYGPAHRKARHPNADWAFLVQVARNLAAAFDTVHAHGHIIGDVNQGNVLVAPNAVVKLIDCDSFQISSGQRQFLCAVGVPHFTAPELQQRGSFSGLPRTVHHDNFGLAVLIFHLLFMGRHPFAGVYAGGTDMPIERAIKEFRYAFARDAAARGMHRPPDSVGPELVTGQLAELFEQAFRRGTDSIERPLARDWVQALEGLKRDLRTCGTEAMHRYYGRLPACPWCELEGTGLLYFIGNDSDEVSLAQPAWIDLEATWDGIYAAMAQQPQLPEDPATIVVKPARLPLRIRLGRAWPLSMMVLSVLIAAPFILAVPGLSIVFLFIGASLMGSLVGPHESRQDEFERRSAEERIAERHWNELKARWREATGVEASDRKFAELLDARQELMSLEDRFARARRDLERSAEQRQLKQFLSRFHIDEAVLPMVGPGHKATLASFGIETAADLQRGRLIMLPGLAEEVVNELLDWQCTLEDRFRFDAARALEPRDLRALQRRFAQRRRQLVRLINGGAAELQRLIVRDEEQSRALLPAGRVAARALAQARADLTVF